ncbi:MAG: hypothetical protein V3V89_01030, partial [Gammaproteobacteria bacterium]
EQQGSAEQILSETVVTSSLATAVEWSSPEEWLQHISQLWEEREKAEAIEDFKRFKEKYPDFPEDKIHNIFKDNSAGLLLEDLIQSENP